MPGKKTSVWLGADEIEGWQELGTSLTVIVKAGIAALRAERDSAPAPALTPEGIRVILREELGGLPDEEGIRRIVRNALADVTGH